jgi:aspartokinase
LAEIVRRRVDRLALVRDALNMGVLNFSAFANSVKDSVEAEFGRKVTREAIVLALKRYEDELKKEVVSDEILEVLRDCRFSLNSGMCDVALERNEKVEDAIFAIMKDVDWRKNENFYLILSTSEIEVVLEEKRLKKLESIIPKKRVLSVMKGVSTLEISEAHTIDTPGFLYFVSGVMARNSINILQMMSSHTEITFSLRNDDAITAFRLLKELQEQTASRASASAH